MILATANDFFTSASFVTFGGASSATWIFSNTARRLLRRDSAFIGFLIAVVVSFVVAASTDALGSALDVLIVFLNGCLLFLTAAGMQEAAVAVATPQETGKAKPQARMPVAWLSPWFSR